MNREDKIRKCIKVFFGTIFFCVIITIMLFLLLITRIFDKQLYHESDIKHILEKGAIKQLYKNFTS